MKNIFGLIVLGLFVLGLVATGYSQSGEELFTKHCVKCHKGGKKLDKLSQMSEEEAIKVVTEGGKPEAKPKMPGYKDKLSADQIKEVTSYTRTTFGGKK